MHMCMYIYIYIIHIYDERKFEQGSRHAFLEGLHEPYTRRIRRFQGLANAWGFKWAVKSFDFQHMLCKMLHRVLQGPSMSMTVGAVM